MDTKIENKKTEGGQENVGKQIVTEGGWRDHPPKSRTSSECSTITNAGSTVTVTEETSSSLAVLEEATGAVTLKRKRLTTSQKKKLRKLMVAGKPYDVALKAVLEEKTETIRSADEVGETVTQPVSKKMRINPSYAETAGMIRVGIIPKGYPMTRLDLDEQKAIEGAIIGELHKLPDDGPQVRFQGCSFKPGWIVVKCADEASRVWLKEIIDKLHPIGKDVVAVEGVDIPKPNTATAFFPGCSLQAEEILRVLHSQNRMLPTGNWKVLNRSVTAQGTMLTVAMDDISVSLLTELKGCPYFNMGRVQFKVRNEQGKPSIANRDERTAVGQEEPSTSKQARTSTGVLTKQQKVVVASRTETPKQKVTPATVAPAKPLTRQTSLTGRINPPGRRSLTERAAPTAMDRLRRRGRGGKRAGAHTKAPFEE